MIRNTFIHIQWYVCTFINFANTFKWKILVMLNFYVKYTYSFSPMWVAIGDYLYSYVFGLLMGYWQRWTSSSLSSWIRVYFLVTKKSLIQSQILKSEKKVAYDIYSEDLLLPPKKTLLPGASIRIVLIIPWLIFITFIPAETSEIADHGHYSWFDTLL